MGPSQVAVIASVVPPLRPTAGVAEPFDALYRSEGPGLVRLAFLLVGAEGQAEELVHDAFAAVLERWGSLERPAAYLRTCVVNGARRVNRRKALERRWRGLGAPGDAELGADHLLDALRRLPAKQRAALVLRYYEDLPEAEIATVLGVRPGTVKSLLHRGLTHLRGEIER